MLTLVGDAGSPALLPPLNWKNSLGCIFLPAFATVFASFSLSILFFLLNSLIIFSWWTYKSLPCKSVSANTLVEYSFSFCSLADCLVNILVSNSIPSLVLVNPGAAVCIMLISSVFKFPGRNWAKAKANCVDTDFKASPEAIPPPKNSLNISGSVFCCIYAFIGGKASNNLPKNNLCGANKPVLKFWASLPDSVASSPIFVTLSNPSSRLSIFFLSISKNVFFSSARGSYLDCDIVFASKYFANNACL